jgi:hypothetical protein
MILSSLFEIRYIFSWDRMLEMGKALILEGIMEAEM